MSFELNVEFTRIDCGECGGSYAINERYRSHQESKGGSWSCPYCHTGWGYSKSFKTRIDKLEEAVAERNRRIINQEAELAAKEKDRLIALKRIQELQAKLKPKPKRRKAP